MSEKTYRIIQWMTGDVGQVGVRHFADNPVFDLVGVLVHSKEKVGKDAGEIAGIAPIGVVATDDIESIVAMDADCVFYTPIIMDVDTVCRLLRSGKNVVTTSGFFHPDRGLRARRRQIRAACEDGGTSFHAGGIHPGYAGDILPLTLARVISKIDQIQRLRSRERPHRCAAGPHRLDGFRQGQGQIPLRANHSGTRRAVLRAVDAHDRRRPRRDASTR